MSGFFKTVLGGLGGGLGGAILGNGLDAADANKEAAATQANAANRAADMSMQQYQTTRSDLMPYNTLGQTSIDPMLEAMGYNRYMGLNKLSPLQQQFSYAPSAQDNALLGKQFSFNPTDLASTPGYQFALQQGLRGVNNGLNSRGLGLSGAQIKGAEQYATGLADQTYGQQFGRAMDAYQTNFNRALGNTQNQFNQAQGQFQTNYNSAANNVNRLMGLVQMGQNSAAQTGSMGANAVANAGNLLTQGANAQAAGIIGANNAVGSALGNVGNMLMMNQMWKTKPGGNVGPLGF